MFDLNNIIAQARMNRHRCRFYPNLAAADSSMSQIASRMQQRAGVDVPPRFFAVKVDGEYIGLFFLSEWMDQHTHRANFIVPRGHFAA